MRMIKGTPHINNTVGFTKEGEIKVTIDFKSAAKRHYYSNKYKNYIDEEELSLLSINKKITQLPELLKTDEQVLYYTSEFYFETKEDMKLFLKYIRENKGYYK